VDRPAASRSPDGGSGFVLGVKPPAAARAADIAPGLPLGSQAPAVRFGTPHACVIVVFVITAAVLATLGMAVQDVLLLIGGAGTMGAAVVLAVVTGGRCGGGLGRFLRAYLNSGG
jgi:hypothetical protein